MRLGLQGVSSTGQNRKLPRREGVTETIIFALTHGTFCTLFEKIPTFGIWSLILANIQHGGYQSQRGV